MVWDVSLDSTLFDAIVCVWSVASLTRVTMWSSRMSQFLYSSRMSQLTWLPPQWVGAMSTYKGVMSSPGGSKYFARNTWKSGKIIYMLKNHQGCIVIVYSYSEELNVRVVFYWCRAILVTQYWASISHSMEDTYMGHQRRCDMHV